MSFRNIVLTVTALAAIGHATIVQAVEGSSPVKSIVVGPTLTNNHVTACVLIDDGTKCSTLPLPDEIGKITKILQTVPIKNSTTSWYALSSSGAAFCGMDILNNKIACSPISGFHDAFVAAPSARRQKLSDTLISVKPAIRAAVTKASKALSTSSGGMSTNSIDNGGYTPGDGGGVGGDGDIPIVIVPGEVDPGEVEIPGDGGDNSGGTTSPGEGETIPPGTAPSDSKARAACTSSAYVAWAAVDLVCKAYRGAEQRACNDYNWQEYTYSLELCNQIP